MRSNVATDAEAAHQIASPMRKPARSWRTKAASTTIATAPINVPTIRNIDLRSEAPSTGWQTSAAVVAAQEGSLSSRAKATQRERQTEAQSLRPNSSAGVATCKRSASGAPPEPLTVG